MRVNDCYWELNYLRARLQLSILYTSSLKIQNQQVSLFRFEIVSLHGIFDEVDLSLGKSSSIFLRKFNTNLTYITHIINATMMFSLMFDIQSLKHLHHACRSLVSFDLGKIFFNIDIISEVLTNAKFFLFGFLFKTTSKIPITTGHHGEIIIFEIIEFYDPFIKFFKYLRQLQTWFNHFLCDSCELSAKRRKLSIDGGFDIVMKDIKMFARGQMYNNDGNFYDLRTRLYFFILHTGSLKIKNKKILYILLMWFCLHTFYQFYINQRITHLVYLILFILFVGFCFEY